jgi:hypothetical protein
VRRNRPDFKNKPTRFSRKDRELGLATNSDGPRHEFTKDYGDSFGEASESLHKGPSTWPWEAGNLEMANVDFIATNLV